MVEEEEAQEQEEEGAPVDASTEWCGRKVPAIMSKRWLCFCLLDGEPLWVWWCSRGDEGCRHLRKAEKVNL